MRAVVQHTFGGAETLRLEEVPMPEPGKEQMRVKVFAAGVNRADIVQREGRYPPPPGITPILGLEIAGVVEQTWPDSRFKEGDEVFALVAGGGYAEYAIVDVPLAIPKPAALSWTEAASLPEAWMTAWLNLVEVGRLAPGQTALIHAGASGVGAAAIQLAARLGAKVIASAGNQGKLDFCSSLGAAETFNYRELSQFAEFVNEHGGADVILDPVGQTHFEQNLACLNQDGRLVLIGVMGGVEGKLNLGRLLVKRHAVIGSTLRNQPLEVKAKLARAIEENVLPWLDEGKISTTLDASFLIESVAEAHRYLERNQNLGKLLLTLGSQ